MIDDRKTSDSARGRGSGWAVRYHHDHVAAGLHGRDAAERRGAARVRGHRRRRHGYSLLPRGSASLQQPRSGANQSRRFILRPAPKIWSVYAYYLPTLKCKTVHKLMAHHVQLHY